MIFFDKLYEQIVKTWNNPNRIVNLTNLTKLRTLIKNLRSSEPIVHQSHLSWQSDGNHGFQVRAYQNYEEYIQHQQSKLNKIKDTWLGEYDVQYRVDLRERLKAQNIIQPGMNVLCLAARIGTEVKSFLDLGCFAVGLDLNPGTQNKYVVYGDFHDLQFTKNSVDIVFTNSLDHALDIEKILSEVKRVLKPDGFFIIEVGRGIEEGVSPGYYESFWWLKVDDLISIFSSHSFKLIKRDYFEHPPVWQGDRKWEHLCFQK